MSRRKNSETINDTKHTIRFESTEAQSNMNISIVQEKETKRLKQRKIKHTISKVGIVRENQKHQKFEQMQVDSIPQLKLDLSLAKQFKANDQKIQNGEIYQNKQTSQQGGMGMKQSKELNMKEMNVIKIKESKNAKNKKGKIYGVLLIIISLCKIFLFPISYSFTATLFSCFEEYHFTFIPDIPVYVKTIIVLVVQTGIYLLVTSVYLSYKYRNQKCFFHREVLFNYAALGIIFQLSFLFFWMDGWEKSLSIYERANFDTNFGSGQCVVSLLLKWRFLWIMNAGITGINFICLLIYFFLKKFINFQ